MLTPAIPVPTMHLSLISALEISTPQFQTFHHAQVPQLLPQSLREDNAATTAVTVETVKADGVARVRQTAQETVTDNGVQTRLRRCLKGQQAN